MRQKTLIAVTAAALILISQSATAKPMDFIGNGCLYQFNFTSSFAYLGQTFTPTFSALKKAKFVVYQTYTYGTVKYFHVDLHDATGTWMATSTTAMLDTDVTIAEAQRGEALVFSFGGGIAVTPGTTYQLRLIPEQGANTGFAVCTGFNLYPDGYMFDNLYTWPTDDMEFALAGGGKPK